MASMACRAIGPLATLVGVPAVTALLGGAVTVGGVLPFAAGLAGLLLAAPRRPVAVLLVSAGLVVAARTAGLTEWGWVWPLSAAYAVAVVGGRLQWAVGVGVAQLGFAAAWEWAVEGRRPPATAADIGTEALWLALVLAAAVAVRYQRRWRFEVVAWSEENAARRFAEQRLLIAREVHDVVAHTLTVVGVQLRVAAEALDDSPDRSRAAIATAQEVRREAMADLRDLVGVLRAEKAVRPRNSPPAGVPAPVARLGDLPRIVAAVSSDSLTTELVTTGETRPVPVPVGLALTRVVQESLTNVVRHAAARAVRVSLHYGQSAISVNVIDDGIGGPPSAGGGEDLTGGLPGLAEPGHGLAGLRERVTALGGAFAAGPAPGRGFVVTAQIPAPVS